MARIGTDPGTMATIERPTVFLGMRAEMWIKIMIGWIVAMIVGGAGWFLHIRDSLSDRPTSASVSERIESAAQPTIEKVREHREDIRANAAKIQSIEIESSAYVQIQKTHTDILKQQAEQLGAIQADIKKILYRQRNSDVEGP